MTADLSTRYLGIELANPIVVSACHLLTGDLTVVQRLEQAGAAAVSLPSLFVEQIEADAPRLGGSMAEDSHQSVVGLFGRGRGAGEYNTSPDGYLEHIEIVKKSVSIPVFASLNAMSHGGWIDFAKLIEQAGADALELNIFFVPSDANLTPTMVEDRYVETVAAVRGAISLPLAVKIGPFFSALPHTAARLAAAGADSLILFNRYLAPEVDIERYEVKSCLDLSHPSELRLALRWIAILRGQLDISLGATGGVHQAEDVVKALLVGADVVMPASTLIRNGPDHLAQMLAGVRHWFDAKKQPSLSGVKGLLSHANYTDASMFARANYMNAISEFRTDAHGGPH